MLLHTFTSRASIEQLCASGQSFPEAVDALCAGDERIESLALAGDDPWLHMLAGDRAFRLHDYERALDLYERAPLRGVLEAAILARHARVLRAMGRYDVAASLTPEGDPYFEYLQTVESGSDPLIGASAQARATGGHGDGLLAELAKEPTIDELVFAAASEGAPPSLTEQVASDGREFQRATAAVCAWALGWRSGDESLRQRAATAYATLDGTLDLSAIDLMTLRETPAELLAAEQRHSIRTQAELRLAAWIAWEGEVPSEWRELVHAVLFLAERPALNR